MILDLTNVPFTRRNSYMVISYITDQFRLFGRKIAEDEGLYLRSVRGDCRMSPLIAHLVPTYRERLLITLITQMEQKLSWNSRRQMPK